MSDTVWLGLIAAVPATIAAWVGIRNSRKADMIHTLVNSQLTAVKTDLLIANQRIAALQAMLEKRNGTQSA